jgi:glucosamine 6-phosphate synthetase-like amidotransferase/phosphosugar isomerase protein
MCGIAGYSASNTSSIDRTLAAQALLAGIAERGEDAVGYAHRSAASVTTVHKQQTGASGMLDNVWVDANAGQVLVHVRDFTKGHPSLDVNNHPIRHGAVVGVHNGIIANDEEILGRHRFEREWPGVTVDSEVIFALAEATMSDPGCLEELHGSMAAAWLDERDSETIFVARGIGRPLWIGEGRNEVFFASTEAALEVVERSLRVELLKAEVREGSQLRLVDGRVESLTHFEPDRSYEDARPLPAVRAPREGAYCLERMAVLAAWTMA